MFQTARVLLFPVLLLLFINCFDYRERIVFSDAWKGYVEMSYSVPVFAETGQSMVGFLPVRKSDVERHYSRLIFTRKIEAYRLFYLSRAEQPFRNYARVSFRIAFENPGELEQILPGQVQIAQRKDRLRIQRDILRANMQEENSVRLLQTYAETAQSVLENHRLILEMAFPAGWTVESSGRVVGQEVSLVVPLEATLKNQESQVFQTELRLPAMSQRP